MARSLVGGTPGDHVASYRSGGSRNAGPAQATWWSVEDPTVQLTDLLLLDGTPVTSVRLGSEGLLPAHYWPDGIKAAWLRVAGVAEPYLYRVNEGPAGPSGAPGGSDAAMAGWIEDEASQTRASLSGVVETAAETIAETVADAKIAPVTAALPGQIAAGAAPVARRESRQAVTRLALPSLMTSPPSITTTGPTPSEVFPAGAAYVRLSAAVINAATLVRARGSAIADFAGGDNGFTGAYGTLSTQTGKSQTWGVDFFFRGAGFSIYHKAAGKKYRVLVNGQPAQTVQTPAASGNYQVYVDFGSRAVRRVSIEFEGGFKLGGFQLLAGDSIWAAPVGVRGIVFGDSYVWGEGALSQLESFARTLGRALGWDDVWASGLPGTGYVSFGAEGASRTYGGRLATDFIPAAPDVGIIAGSYNDYNQTPAAIQAAATGLYAAIATARPDMPLYVIGAFQPTATPAAGLTAANGAVKAAALAAPNVRRFIDPTGWVNAANQALVTAGDNVHPSPEGHDYLAFRAAAEIAS